jgi:hypothetical protein
VSHSKNGRFLINPSQLDHEQIENKPPTHKACSCSKDGDELVVTRAPRAERVARMAPLSACGATPPHVPGHRRGLTVTGVGPDAGDLLGPFLYGFLLSPLGQLKLLCCLSLFLRAHFKKIITRKNPNCHLSRNISPLADTVFPSRAEVTTSVVSPFGVCQASIHLMIPEEGAEEKY